jgi:hypothetical protein
MVLSSTNCDCLQDNTLTLHRDSTPSSFSLAATIIVQRYRQTVNLCNKRLLTVYYFICSSPQLLVPDTIQGFITCRLSSCNYRAALQLPQQARHLKWR